MATNSDILALLLTTIIIVCILNPSSAGASSVSHSVNLQSNERRCWTFYTPEKEAMHLSASFEMLQLEDEIVSTKPLYVSIHGEGSKDPIYTSPLGAGDGEFDAVIKGRHEFCIANGINRNPIDGTRRREDGVERSVAFTVHVRPQYLAQADGPESLPMANTMNLAQKLGDNLVLLLDHFEYFKKQEHIHQELAGNTFGMLWKWTLLEAAVLIGIAVLQIHYLRRFFETKRYL